MLGKKYLNSIASETVSLISNLCVWKNNHKYHFSNIQSLCLKKEHGARDSRFKKLKLMSASWVQRYHESEINFGSISLILNTKLVPLTFSTLMIGTLHPFEKGLCGQLRLSKWGLQMEFEGW
jgi:hypothetical protein